MKGPTEADFSAWTAEILIQGKDFPITLHSLLVSPRAPSLCNTAEAEDNHAILLIKRKETLSSSLARAILSFSRECPHGECIHSPGLASQSLSGLQCCRVFRMALLILKFNSMILLIYPSLEIHIVPQAFNFNSSITAQL